MISSEALTCETHMSVTVTEGTHAVMPTAPSPKMSQGHTVAGATLFPIHAVTVHLPSKADKWIASCPFAIQADNQIAILEGLRGMRGAMAGGCAAAAPAPAQIRYRRWGWQISKVGLAAVSFLAVGEAPPCLGSPLVRLVAGGFRLLTREAPPGTWIVAGIAGCGIEFVRRSRAWRGKS